MRKWLPGLHENRRTLSSAGFRSSSLAATEHAPAARACAVGAAEVSAISCPGRAESRGAASLPHLGREAGRRARQRVPHHLAPETRRAARRGVPASPAPTHRSGSVCACARERGRRGGARLTVPPGESARGRRGRWGQARSGRSSVLGRCLPPRPGPQLVARRDFPCSVPELTGAGSLSLLVMKNVQRARARPGHPRAPRPLRGPNPDREPCPHHSVPSATQSFLRKQPVGYIADH